MPHMPNHLPVPTLSLAPLLVLFTQPVLAQPMFIDATEASGLIRDGIPIAAARVGVADLNNDGYPDLILDRVHVFLNRTTPAGRLHFEPVLVTGLPPVQPHDVMAFADLDNDGIADSILGRAFDPQNPNAALPPEGQPQRSAWLKGNGDGTFGSLDEQGRPLGRFHELPVQPASVVAIAVHDVNRDGLPDIALGNSYTAYGRGFDAPPTDLLLQQPDGSFARAVMPDDGIPFSEDDTGGRPSYGIMLADLLSDGRVGVLELNYGRRANRYIVPVDGVWTDIAPRLGIDADDIRHGEYPQWMRDRGRTDERPFRANGNTFDAAITDVNHDGLPDLYYAEITHAWAGDSSDRSRLLIRRGERFVHDPAYTTDRFPADTPNWNQGDIFAAFIDANLDTFPDLLLSSSDYPDPEPNAQRLRLFRNTGSGFMDLHATPESRAAVGFDHRGSAQLAIADFDGDGDEDILVAQSFNRLNAEQSAAIAHPNARDTDGNPAPSVRLYLNLAIEHGGRSIALRLQGAGNNTHWAYGATVRATLDHDNDRSTPDITTTHWLNPIGGHAGKSHDRTLIIPLGRATTADVTIVWPDGMTQHLGRKEHGRHQITSPAPAGEVPERSKGGGGNLNITKP